MAQGIRKIRLYRTGNQHLRSLGFGNSFAHSLSVMNPRTQFAPVQLFEASTPKALSACRRTPVSRKVAAIIRIGPLAKQEETVAISIAEDTSEYKIVAPLTGIDPRSVYVFATPRSVLIEFRFKRVVSHPMIDGSATETIKERISREFSLPCEIERGTTTVAICGESLQITARKSTQEQQKPWSQFIHFDTRASLGCV